MQLSNGNVLVLSNSDSRVLAVSATKFQACVVARTPAGAQELAGEYRAMGAKVQVNVVTLTIRA